MIKKAISVLLIFVSVFSCFLSMDAVYAYGQDLNITQVIDLALKSSPDLRNTSIDLVKKQIELRQAREGIRDIRKKENTWEFSLLFNITPPEQHGLPKEIELIMKMPEIQTEIQNLNKQKAFGALKAKYDAEIAYLDVVQAIKISEITEKEYYAAKDNLIKVERKYKAGKGNKDDVEYMKNEINNLEKELRQAVSDCDNKKERLGKLIGVNVKNAYNFVPYLPQADIKRDELKEIIKFSNANDFELYKVIQERKLSQTRVAELQSIYGNRFGSYVSNIQNYLATHKGKDIDYEKFIQEYNISLDNIDQPWRGNYVINLLFFKIYIPKEWFMRRYSGTRYLEDEKYALFLSVIDREKAAEKETQAYKELEQKVRDTYTVLKQMEISYKEAISSLTIERELYDKALKENLAGRLGFKDLESKRKDLTNKENSIYEMQIEYGKTISMFNLYTSGYLDNKISQGSTQNSSYQSGDSFSTDSTKAPEWYIINTLSDYKFTFGLRNIPKDLEITHYELYANEGTRVGDKTPIDETIVHLPIAYSESTRMYVKLYKEEVMKGIAEFDGGLYGGSLSIKTAESKTKAGDTVGTWRIDVTGYKGEFRIKIGNQIKCDKYALYQKGILIDEKRGLSEAVVHLTATLNQTADMEVRLFNGKEEMSVLKLLTTGEREGTLVVK